MMTPTSLPSATPIAGGGRKTLAVEFSLFFCLLVLGELILAHFHLPLPHIDYVWYVEPAASLATHGVIASPASQNFDLTYTLAYYGYPPGYSLTLGAWLFITGASAASVLAYTHAVHAAYLALLWAMLRLRLGCGRLATGLVIVSAYPLFAHGRPDVTALMFGAAGYCLLPRRPDVARTIACGVLLGLALVTSPGYGISSTAAALTFGMLDLDATTKRRLGFGVAAGGTAVLVMASVWLAVVAQQGAWAHGWSQFNVASKTRGRDLNVMPSLWQGYAVAVAVIPLGLCALLPAVLAVGFRRRAGAPLFKNALAYVAGFAVWFAVNKTQVLLQNHLNYLGRMGLQGHLPDAGGRSRWLRAVGYGPVLVVAAVGWYLDKSLLVHLGRAEAVSAADIAALGVPLDGVVAAEGQTFFPVWRPGRTISYIGFMVLRNYWQRSKAVTPPAAWNSLPPAVRAAGPAVPDVIIVTSDTLLKAGRPDPTVYRQVAGPPSVELVRLFGRPVKEAKRPSELNAFVLR